MRALKEKGRGPPPYSTVISNRVALSRRFTTSCRRLLGACRSSGLFPPELPASDGRARHKSGRADAGALIPPRRGRRLDAWWGRQSSVFASSSLGQPVGARRVNPRTDDLAGMTETFRIAVHASTLLLSALHQGRGEREARRTAFIRVFKRASPATTAKLSLNVMYTSNALILCFSALSR